jgi:hypothetical protein
VLFPDQKFSFQNSNCSLAQPLFIWQELIIRFFSHKNIEIFKYRRNVIQVYSTETLLLRDFYNPKKKCDSYLVEENLEELVQL